MSSSLYSNQKFMSDLSAILGPYKIRFEKLLSSRSGGSDFGPIRELREATAYAMAAGGKRFRPAIVWMVSDAVGLRPKDAVDELAFAVEYFHTSSLVADDLPCMDDDDFRRGVPSTHKAFSESSALLVSFSLIALGFQSIAKADSFPGAPDDVHKMAVLEASRTMGAAGLLGGQALDLNPPDDSVETAEKIMDMKTGALFDLSFSLGWLFGGGDSKRLGEVHSVAYSFGRAFQIFDDLDDFEQDLAANKGGNYAILFGREAAVSAVRRYYGEALLGMKKLGLYQGRPESECDLIRLIDCIIGQI